jgi:hypothetical protein
MVLTDDICVVGNVNIFKVLQPLKAVANVVVALDTVEGSVISVILVQFSKMLLKSVQLDALVGSVIEVKSRQLRKAVAIVVTLFIVDGKETEVSSLQSLKTDDNAVTAVKLVGITIDFNLLHPFAILAIVVQLF